MTDVAAAQEAGPTPSASPSAETSAATEEDTGTEPAAAEDPPAGDQAPASETAPGLDEDVNAALETLQEDLYHARFSQTRPAAQGLLGREGLTAAQRNQVLEILAVTQVALGEEDAAEQTLTELYRRDPGHRLSNLDLGPSIQAAFARARERTRDRIPVVLEGPTLEPSASGGSPSVRVEVTEGDDAVDAVRLSYREGSPGSFSALTLGREDPGVARARLPTVESGRLEVFVEALAPSGAALASVGDRDAPVTLDVPRPAPQAALSLAGDRAMQPEEEPGLLERWWFWTAVGVVVAGAVTGYVLLGPPSAGPDAGSLGQGGLE